MNQSIQTAAQEVEAKATLAAQAKENEDERLRASKEAADAAEAARVEAGWRVAA